MHGFSIIIFLMFISFCFNANIIRDINPKVLYQNTLTELTIDLVNKGTIDTSLLQIESSGKDCSTSDFSAHKDIIQLSFKIICVYAGSYNIYYNENNQYYLDLRVAVKISFTINPIIYSQFIPIQVHLKMTSELKMMYPFNNDYVIRFSHDKTDITFKPPSSSDISFVGKCEFDGVSFRDYCGITCQKTGYIYTYFDYDLQSSAVIYCHEKEEVSMSDLKGFFISLNMIMMMVLNLLLV